MAAVLEKQAPAEKFELEVEEQIAGATSRIRTHDLTFGALLIAGLVLVYTTVMILLDKYLVLPEWVRQLGLLAFLSGIGGITYATIIRPLSRRVNPLYAAVQVERTIEDAKNSVVGYVEARERSDLSPTIRAAMSARAARSVGDADLNRAVDHRGLVYIGGSLIVLLLVLVVLFFTFRPTQFKSLLGRAFVPFTSDPIANQTLLTLIEPTGDITITSGQSLTISAEVGGRIPRADKPDRVRLLMRHNPTDPTYEEIPLEQGENIRQWQLRIPDYLVRNGFWFKLAGGDAETPEYKVSVRSAPLFTEFELAYEFPAYTRRAAETTKDPHIVAYRNTKVTLNGKTNRAVREGRLTFDPPGREPVIGKPIPERPDSLKFEFLVGAPGSYKLNFTSTEGERAPDSPAFGIQVIEDQAPAIEILKPEEDEVSIPANGQLAIDARIGDDFGIDKVTLKMKVIEPSEHILADKPFLGGKSFHRDRDDSWPRDLEYLDSVDLARLTDTAGIKIALKEGMVLAYWLEAADNRTRPGTNGPEPDPNIGKSKVKKVRVTAARMDPEQNQKLDNQKQERKNEEDRRNQAQNQKLDKENREANNAKNNQSEQPKPDEQPKEGEPKSGDQEHPKKNADGMKNSENPMPGTGNSEKPKEGNPDAMAKGDPKGGEPMPKMGDPMPGPGNPGEQNSTNKPESAPQPGEAGSKEIEKKAQEIQKQLDQEKNGGGEPRGKPDSQPEDRVPQSNPKPEQPMDGAANPKEKSEPGIGGNAGSKSAGQNDKPDETSTPKSEPMGSGQPGSKADKTPETKPAPQDGNTGMDKGAPKPPDGANPMNGGQPKPDEGAKGNNSGNSGTQNGSKENREPASQPKPTPGSEVGRDKEPGKGEQGQGDQKNQQSAGGDSKPSEAPKGSNQKPGPAGEDQPMGQPAKPEASDASSTPMSNTAPQSKPEGSSATKPELAPRDKPIPADNKNSQQSNSSEQKNGNSNAGAKKELDPKDKAEVENALKNLNSSDPAEQQAAKAKLDEKLGKGAGKLAEDLNKGLNSSDPKERQAAQKQIEDLKKQVNGGKDEGQANSGKKELKNEQGQPGGTQPPKLDAKDKAEVENALKELNSSDPAKQQAAKDKLDEKLGKGAGKLADDLNKKLNSSDPKEQQAAKKQIEEMKNGGTGGKNEGQANSGKNEPKNEQGQPGSGQAPKLDAKDKAEVENALKNLNSSDPAEQQAAKAKLDEKLGKGAGKLAEDLNKGLNSSDRKERQAAQQKLEDLKNQANGGKNEPGQNGSAQKKPPDKGDSGSQQANAKNKVDPKQVDEAIDDLSSPDQKKREAAKKNLDDMLGKGAGQEAADALKQTQSDKFEEQSQGRKRLDDLAKKAESMAKNEPKEPGKSGLNQKDQQELANKLKDLKSEDPEKRKEAEKAFDDKLGKENREKLQDAMKNQPGDGQGDAEAQKKLEEMAKDARSGGEEPNGNQNPKMGGKSSTKLNPAMEDNPRNRARSAGLQLQDFEKNRDNKELQQKLGMSQSEYDRFLEEYRKRVAQLEKVADDAEKEPVPTGSASPTQNIGSAGKVEQRPNSASGPAGVAGPAFAAPGFDKALQKFQENATKRQPKKQP